MQPGHALRERCICGTPVAIDAPVVRRRGAWGLVQFQRCASCGSWLQSPQATREVLAAWYESDSYSGSEGSAYVDYLSDEPARRREAKSRARSLLPLLPPGRPVLEIGCGTGSRIAALREPGFPVRGIDLSSTFVAAARKIHGLDVEVADVADVPLPRSHFGAILMFGTISNLPDLVPTLHKVRAALVPDGVLVANFPDARSWPARVYGDAHWMFALSVAQFLTGTGLQRALSATGFDLVLQTRDRQRPSLRKLLRHMRVPVRMIRCLPQELLALGSLVPVPIPGVRLFIARPSRAR